MWIGGIVREGGSDTQSGMPASSCTSLALVCKHGKLHSGCQLIGKPWWPHTHICSHSISLCIFPWSRRSKAIYGSSLKYKITTDTSNTAAIYGTTRYTKRKGKKKKRDTKKSKRQLDYSNKLTPRLPIIKSRGFINHEVERKLFGGSIPLKQRRYNSIRQTSKRIG